MIGAVSTPPRFDWFAYRAQSSPGFGLSFGVPSRETVTCVLRTTSRRGRHLLEPRVEKAVSGLVSLAVAGAYLAIASLHGALGAARNDDWTYFHSAYRFASDGVFTPGTSTAMLVGQVVLAWPVVRVFGPEIAPLQVLVALMGAVGLWAAYRVIRRILPPSWSAFSVGCVALGPIFGSLGSSFMTDVPAFTLQMLALLTGLRALRSRGVAVTWFAASLVAGIAAFSIREYSLSAPVAVIVAAFLGKRPRILRPGSRVVALTILWTSALVALFVWRRGLAKALPVSWLGQGTLDVTSVLWTGSSLAMLAVPLVFVVSVPRLARSLRTARGAAVVVGLAVVTVWCDLVWTAAPHLFLGNYVTTTGSYSITVPGAAPVVIPSGAWVALEVLSFASLLMLALLALVGARGLLRRGTTPGGARMALPGIAPLVMLVYCVTTMAGLQAAKQLVNSPVFDRNLVPIIPFVVALGIRVARDHGLVVRWTRVVATVTLVVFGSLGIGMIDTSATFDGATWQLARSVEAQGYDAGSIDGGYAWYSYHQTGPLVRDPVTSGTHFWLSQFAERPVCVTVQFEGTGPSGHLAAGNAVVGRVTARSLLGVRYDLVAVAGPASCEPHP